MPGKHEIKSFLKLNGKGFTRGLNRARRDLKKFRRGMDGQMRKIALGIAAVTIAASMIGASFEKEMKNVQSVSGATRTEMVALAASAREMGSTTAFSAKEAAEAQYALASAGQNTTQIMASLPAVLNYAGATQADLAASAEDVTGALNAFGLAAGEANRVANTYAAGIANSPLNQERLSEAMAQGGATAHALGISLEETVAGLGLLHASNIKGAKAGTYFRATLLNLQSAMTDQKGAIGAALQGWDSATDGLQGALKRLEAAGITGKVALQELGVKGGPALAAMLSQGAAKLADLRAKVTGTNQAFDAYKTQMDSTVGRIDILKSTLQEAGLRIWDIIKGPVNQAVTGLTKLVSQNFGKIAQVFRAMLAGVMKFAHAAGAIFAFVQSHATTFQLLAATVGAAVVGLYALATVMGIVNAVMMMNPISVIVVGIAALVAGIAVIVEKFVGWNVVWTTLVGAFKKGFARVKWYVRGLGNDIKYVSKIFGALNATVGIVFRAIWNTVKKAGLLITETFSSIWDVIKDPRKAKETFDQLKDTVAQGLGPILEEAQKEMAATWSGLGTGYAEETKEILNGMAAEVDRIDRDTTAKLDKLRAKRNEASAAIANQNLNMPKNFQFIPDQAQGAALGPESPDILTPVVEQTREAYSVMAEFNSGMSDMYRSTWDSMIDSSMTGAERNRQIFANMRSKVWGIIGDITKRWLWGESVQMAATQKKEAVATASTVKGTSLRIGAKVQEMAIDLKSGVVNAWNATTGFFKAHSSIPFVGAAMAAAAVGLMFKMMGTAKKMLFYEGGPVTGPYGRDVINAGLTRGEYVMPVAETRRWFGELEAMRDGSFAGAPAAMVPVAVGGSGGGTTTINATVQVDKGSLILADNDLSIRRLAERVGQVISDKVNKTFTEG